MRNLKVLAVVVTHNRCALLSRCLDFLARQTTPPEQILVINNASSDGTVELLEQRRIPFVTQENLGSAGGWHRGIQHALDHNFDAVWLMDDDGYPAPDSLAKLRSVLQPEVACASSVVVCENDAATFVFPFPKLNSANLPVLLGYPRKIATLSALREFAVDGQYPFAHFFNGALLSIDAVKRVGNVDCGFFMFGDEVDYFFRMRQAGEVVSVLDALHFHPDVSQRPYTAIKVYYYVKNTIILNRRYFNAVWLRHLLALAAVLARTGRRNGLAAVASLLFGPMAPMMRRAIVRGLQGKVGKDFHA